MKFLAGVLTTVVVAVLVGLALLYSGSYDVAASSGHGPFMHWLLDTGMRNSVIAHAGNASDTSPPSPQRVADGAHEFKEHCAGCHGAPGVEQKGMAKAMLPEPPDLKDAAHEWNAAQLRWIVEHGVKMTAMPAWGKVLKPEELEGVVAFVRAMPGISAADYQHMTGSGGSKDHEGSS
jgi:mono/diheme cytochrome c family protein